MSSSMAIGKNVGIIVPFLKVSEKFRKGNNSNGKSAEEPAHFSGEKENVEEMEIGLVVSEAKRRRSQDMTQLNVGLDGEGTFQSGDFQVGSKNGPAVGAVNQAYRDQ